MLLNNQLEGIGNTPLVKLSGYMAKYAITADIYAKLEWYSLTGSVKDRPALAMIEGAERRNAISKDSLIIEPTSGNMGISIAAICAIKGYKAVIVMPESMSRERRLMIKAYGAKLVLTPASEGMKGAIKKANELASMHEGSIVLSQFTNLDNPASHLQSTGEEIYRDLKGHVDAFVAGVGTGGTIMGVGRYLKTQNANIAVVGVEPEESQIIGMGKSGSHGIQGIGAGFVPDIVKVSMLDRVIAVSTADALSAVHDVVKTDGLFIGISAGAALFASRVLASDEKMRGKNIVTLFADNGLKYMSSPNYLVED